MSKLNKLFKPVQIGTMIVKNRIVMPAMVTNFATEKGEVTKRLINYIVERAKGGVGLITVEGAYIEVTGKRTKNQLGVYSDSLISGLRKLTNAAKRVSNKNAIGVKVSLQLQHGGRECISKITGKQPVGPCSLRSSFTAISKTGEIPKELTIKEIQNIIELYAEGARRAKESGFDAIELHAAHGYLIHQFLSPESNKRTDKYGGNLRKRTRFICEIIE